MDDFDRLLDIVLPGDDGNNGSNRHDQNKMPQKKHPEILANKSVCPPVNAEAASSSNIVSVINKTKDNIMAMYSYDDDSWTSGKIIVAVIILGIILLAGLFILKDPLARHIEINDEKLRNQKKEIKIEKQYENLEYDIVMSVNQTDERLIKLNREAKSLAAKIEANIGMSLKYLLENPEERPKELDEIILKSDTFARDWSAVINTILAEHPPANFRLPLSELHRRIKSRKLTPADRKLLTELTVYLDKTEQLLEKQGVHVNEIIGLMKARQLVNDLISIERN